MPDLRVYVRSGFFILLCNGGCVITKSRDELIFMLSFKGFTSDYLMTKDDETLENLYIEYIILAEDYVWRTAY